MSVDILLPVGRMVGGSLYQAFPRTDSFGKPVLGKDGQPVKSFSIGIAIPKAGEQHWNQTAWGSQIWQVGSAAFAREHAAPSFAWKITDGDSQVPNKKGNVPAQQEGYPGNWVLWLNQSWAPKIVDAKGINEIVEKDAVIPGYFVQAYIGVAGNSSTVSPGVYLNPLAIALAGYGTPIITASSVDTTNVGFGNSALPPGASAAPVAQAQPLPGQVGTYGTFVQPAPPAYMPPPANVAPLAAFSQVPGLPPAPPPPAEPQLTAKAAGATYAQMVAAGWTDELLRQHGYLI